MHGELVVEQGPQANQRFKIRLGQVFVIGRGSGVSINLDDDRISRRHAEAELRPDGWLYVRDLSSRNGTFLRGSPLPPHEEARLAPGDRLDLGGGTIMRVELLGETPDDTTILPSEEFQVLGELGRGSSGVVYAVRQRLLDRTVAVKLLRVDDERERQRVLRQARLTMRIESPYVVEMFDVRQFGGHLAMVLELVDGPSLADVLASGQGLGIPQAIALGENVAAGLREAHRHGVIHRDVKPANLLVTPLGVAKLTDFGLARDLRSRGSGASTELVQASLPYMSPEQMVRCDQADPRSDIYSLGATLYHLIGGQPPFMGRTLQEVLSQAPVGDPRDLRELNESCPEDVAELVQAAIARAPDERPADAASFARQLREVRERHFEDVVVADPARRTNSARETRG